MNTEWEYPRPGYKSLHCRTSPSCGGALSYWVHCLLIKGITWSFSQFLIRYVTSHWPCCPTVPKSCKKWLIVSLSQVPVVWICLYRSYFWINMKAKILLTVDASEGQLDSEIEESKWVSLKERKKNVFHNFRGGREWK